jgi:hypothetical protein
LRCGAKTDLAGEARIAVRHADGRRLMMRVNVFEPVFFTQFDNDVLVGIAHDCENMIDAFSRNPFRKRFKYLHGDLYVIDATAHR